MSIAIIINPISGGVRPDAARGARRARAAVVDRARRSGGGLRHRSAAAMRASWRRRRCARGARLVVAWGGDGTINEVASALAFGDVPLGIVPAGSGNGLARELGVSRAARARDRRRARGASRGRSTSARSTAGCSSTSPASASTRTSRRGSTSRRRRRGFVGYAGITARALTSYVPQRYRITATDGVDRRARDPRDDRELRAVRQRRPHRAGRARRRWAARSGGGGGALAAGDDLSSCRGCSTARSRRVPRLHDPARSRDVDDRSRSSR